MGAGGGRGGWRSPGTLHCEGQVVDGADTKRAGWVCGDVGVLPTAQGGFARTGRRTAMFYLRAPHWIFGQSLLMARCDRLSRAMHSADTLPACLHNVTLSTAVCSR
jgi:hypothetical protein